MLAVIETSPLGSPVALHPVTVYLASKTKASRSSLLGALRFAFGAVGLQYESVATWQALEYATLSALQAKLLETNKAPTTIKHAFYAIRGVLRVAQKLGYISKDQLESALSVETLRGSSSVLAGRQVEEEEALTLGQVIAEDSTPAGKRDRALLAVLWGAGIRRAELVALERSSLDIEQARLIVYGKGRKYREVFLGEKAIEALKAWLAIRGDKAGALFGAVSKSGRVSLEHMSAQAVYTILEKRQKQAGIQHFSPHDLRRTYASTLLEKKVDISTVADLLGHESITTTARYDRRSSERKKRASSLLSSPF